MSIAPSAGSPLERTALQEAVGPGWQIDLRGSTGSTNADARENAVPGLIVVAEEQTAGRGRLDREWQSAPGRALTFSVVLDPRLPDPRWPLVPLAAALAVADGIAATTGTVPALKWPNDVLLADPGLSADQSFGQIDGVGLGKVAGLLLERVPGLTGLPLAVVGIGLNVSTERDRLPVPTATSLGLVADAPDRHLLLGAIVGALEDQVTRLRQNSAAFLAGYRERCVTLGREVAVDLPDGTRLLGLAEAVDDDGRLVVAGTPVAAGDVVHTRGLVD